MMSDLTVELYGTSIGQLRGDWRSFDFHATPSALAEFGIDSPVLSLAIPLAPHQEDLAQALGLIGNEKYQRHGGRVSLKRIAATLSGVGLSPDALLRLVTLAVAVGNLDLHAKNISLLHNPDGSMELAPAYDVVPQAHQPSDGEMALSVDDEYRHAALTRESLIREAQSWGLSSPETTVAETLETVRETARREAPLDGSHPGIASDVENFATRLLNGQPAGDAPSTRGYHRDT